MSDVTTQFLQARGVSMTPGELNAAMLAALQNRRARFTLAPREELTADQAALLERGGLDLSPKGAGERLQADMTSAD